MGWKRPSNGLKGVMGNGIDDRRSISDSSPKAGDTATIIHPTPYEGQEVEVLVHIRQVDDAGRLHGYVVDVRQPFTREPAVEFEGVFLDQKV